MAKKAKAAAAASDRIRMVSQTTFTGRKDEFTDERQKGFVRMGRDFTVADTARADYLEKRGLAKRVAEPKAAADVEQPNPLSTRRSGSRTGGTKRASSSPLVRPQQTSRSRKSKGAAK